MKFALIGCGKWSRKKTLAGEAATKLPVPTAGPYTCKYGHDGVDDFWGVFGREGRHIAYYPFWDDRDGKSEAIEADFRLLAAAPELLDALDFLLDASSRLPFSFFNGMLFNAMGNGQKVLAKTFGKNWMTTVNALRKEMRHDK